MKIVNLTSGESFSIQSGISVLDAALQSNVLIPYSCKTGRCSTCKCKVLAGATYPLHPEDGLSQNEKDDGWVLSCVREVLTDVLIEVDYISDVIVPPAKTMPCRIDEIKKITDDVVKVWLRLPPTADFSYISGQYVDLIGLNGVRRSYSLANACGHDKRLELHIRFVESGFMSDYWFHKAKVNDLLRLHGPLGTFFLRDTAGVDLIFLATGTGIAPVQAMLQSLIAFPEDKQPKSITVLWGGREYKDIYLEMNDFPLVINYIPVLSRENGWNGKKSYVQDVLLGLGMDLSAAAVYACGSSSMIHSARNSLIAAGLPANRFYSDAFVCSGSN